MERMTKQEIREILMLEGKPCSDACIVEYLLDRLYSAENRVYLAMKKLDELGWDTESAIHEMYEAFKRIKDVTCEQ